MLDTVCNTFYTRQFSFCLVWHFKLLTYCLRRFQDSLSVVRRIFTFAVLFIVMSCCPVRDICLICVGHFRSAPFGLSSVWAYRSFHHWLTNCPGWRGRSNVIAKHWIVFRDNYAPIQYFCKLSFEKVHTMIGCFVQTWHSFLHLYIYLRIVVTNCFCFALMTSHRFPISVDKNLGCDLAIERSIQTNLPRPIVS